DIPGRQAITTFDVGGDPHFIITGLYPPAVGTTPQQANILTTLLTIAGYVLVVAVLVVPILLFRRYSKAQRKAWQTRAETNPDEEPTQILDERAEQTGQAKSQVDPRNEQ
ncbi:MAG: hypothetical protein J2P37_29680, partial [Ktedonobacteraceae bacterium]|nr:hypothetical protein [Ktedonobacteraceae bacterium]